MDDILDKTIETIKTLKKIDELSKEYPNDMEFGKRVRNLLYELREVKDK